MKKRFEYTVKEGDLGEDKAIQVYERKFGFKYLGGKGSKKTEYDLFFFDGSIPWKVEAKCDLPAMYPEYMAFPLELADSNLDYYVKKKNHPTITLDNGTVVALTGWSMTTANEAFLTDSYSWFRVPTPKLKTYIEIFWDEIRHFKNGTNTAYGITIPVDRLKKISSYYHIDETNPMIEARKKALDLLNNLTEAK